MIATLIQTEQPVAEPWPTQVDLIMAGSRFAPEQNRKHENNCGSLLILQDLLGFFSCSVMCSHLTVENKECLKVTRIKDPQTALTITASASP